MWNGIWIDSLIGLFMGLQVSTLLGNILMFPFLSAGSLINEPVGNCRFC